MKKCPYCKATLPVNAFRCRNCRGWAIQPPWGETLGESPQWYIGYRLVTGIISLIFFLIFLLALFYPTWVRAMF